MPDLYFIEHVLSVLTPRSQSVAEDLTMPEASSRSQTEAQSNGDGISMLSRDEALDMLRNKIVDGLGEPTTR